MASFILAFAKRQTTGESIIARRSACDMCGHKLGWLELIPITSWLIQLGRCKHCRGFIGFTPIISEVILGVWFVLSYQKTPQVSFGSVFLLLLGAIGLYISLYDWMTKRIQKTVLLAFAALTAAYFVTYALLISAEDAIMRLITATVAGFALAYLKSPKVVSNPLPTPLAPTSLPGKLQLGDLWLLALCFLWTDEFPMLLILTGVWGILFCLLWHTSRGWGNFRKDPSFPFAAAIFSGLLTTLYISPF